MNILEIADYLMGQTGGDGRAAVILALQYTASPGLMRAAPLVFEDVREFRPDPEPLNIADEQAPHG